MHKPVSLFISLLFFQLTSLQATTSSSFYKNELNFYSELNDRSNDTIIYLNASPCIGQCKSYSLLLLSTGEVYLHATENMYLEGYFVHKLKKPQFKLLKKRINELNWKSFSTVYPSDEQWIDGLPEYKLINFENGRRKKIRCQYDCPREIMHIINYLEEIIPNLEWRPVIM